MKQLDLSRPDVLFGLLWLSTTALAYADLYYMGFDSSVAISSLIISNILSFFGVYILVSRFFGKENNKINGEFVNDVDLLKLTKVSYVLSAVWVVLFFFIIYKSQGLPILWSLNHLNKTYIDYGVPTLSGFANALRVLIFCLSILIYIKNKNKTILILTVLMMFSSLTELARANTIYLALCGLAVYLLNIKVRLSARLFLFSGVAITLIVILFGLVEKIRSPEGSGGEKILQYESVLNKLPYGVTNVYLYVTTPVSNLYFAEAHGIQPLYYPYYSLQAFVPTVIRNKLFAEQEYPIKLRRASHNATTFYSPFVADFGILTAGILVFIIQLIVSFVHVRARQGRWDYQLIYAPLFTSVALSFFYNYFISLSVLIFPLFVYFVKKATKHQHN